MSILILSRVPHDLCPYEEWFQDLNEDLILLTSDEYAEGFDPSHYAYYESFTNYTYNGNVDLRAVELYEKYKYRAVLAISERDVLRASQLREMFDIPGQTWDSAFNFRNKLRMKEICQENGIIVPRFAPVHTPLDLIEFIQNYGFPVVVKPVDSAGSEGTTVLLERKDLEQFLASGIPHNIEVEAFIPGQMYHVDGLILNGELVYISASKYLESCLSFQSGGYTGSYLIDPSSSLSLRLIELTRQVLAVMNPPHHTTFHAEFFHTPDDQLIFCEIASRTAGGRVNIYLDQAYEVNLSKSWLLAQCGVILPIPKEYQLVPPPPPKQYSGFVLIPPRKGQFLSVDDHDLPEWVTEFRVVAKPGQHFLDPRSSVDHMASLVVKGETDEEVFQRLTMAVEWIEKRMVWKE